MAELRPDSWRMDELPPVFPVQGVGLRRLGKKPVTDIQLWLCNHGSYYHVKVPREEPTYVRIFENHS